ncbi:MAG: hypothetical protein IKB41_00890 [Clostridia bacterium]|nr:hypothetical protein [Clostridia bacterium]
MIKITFPFSKCSFVVDSISIIESHIFEKFFLFSKYVKAIEDDVQSIVIRTNEYDLSVHNTIIGRIHAIKCNSYYDVFKKITNLIRENTVLSGDVCVLHASFVQMNDKGILLLGESGAGKSTLSAYVHLINGCECYTDDIVFMNYNTNFGQGVSQYINLREPSLKLLPEQCNAVYDDFIQRYKIILNNCNQQKVDYIISLNRQNDIKAKIKPIDDVVNVLIHNMYLPYSLKNNIIAANKLAANTTVCEMLFSDLFSACCLLAELGG